jgi:hypothetical protein
MYCDFSSMYPTVCTLMRLWDFVTAKGLSWRESQIDTQQLLEKISLSDLQDPVFWRNGLHTLVQVQPEADIFPVRAKYGRNPSPESDQPQFTIGLNCVSSDFPLWYTLADCIASKLLTGRAPKVLRAYSFSPEQAQSNLWPVNIMGNPEYRVDPTKDDFYKRLIDLRMEVRARGKKTEEQALKILANATSYGIFVELNVQEARSRKKLRRFGATGREQSVTSDRFEEPGNYFSPLLGTLITGAARLMLAIVETLTKHANLDWAFCDTDSMAFAKPESMSEADFYARSEGVREWLGPLNPFASHVQLFKAEDENREILANGKFGGLAPLYCYAVSSKRYVLFNMDQKGEPILRKASAHGLGHWKPPYQNDKAPKEFPRPKVEPEGIERWQHDLWRRIVVADALVSDENVNPTAHFAFDKPVASPYHATTPTILRWFRTYNEARPHYKHVLPFNFLLAFQMDPTADDPGEGGSASSSRNRKKRAKAKPVAPHDDDLLKAARRCFDRETGHRIPVGDLRTYREALAGYHHIPRQNF